MQLIEHLLPLVRRIPLSIVGVSRLRPDEPLSKLLQVVETHYADCLIHIPLAPLSESSSLTMVEQLLSSHELPVALRDIILRKAEGNPFFVEEVIRTLYRARRDRAR